MKPQLRKFFQSCKSSKKLLLRLNKFPDGTSQSMLSAPSLDSSSQVGKARKRYSQSCLHMFPEGKLDTLSLPRYLERTLGRIDDKPMHLCWLDTAREDKLRTNFDYSHPGNGLLCKGHTDQPDMYSGNPHQRAPSSKFETRGQLSHPCWTSNQFDLQRRLFSRWVRPQQHKMLL